MSKILIVDDSGLSRRLMRGILEPAGHTVIEADEGMAALEKYFIEKPELVLLDLTMPELGGLEVLEKLIQMDPRARVVVASADVQHLTRELVKEKGGLGFISKPFAAEEVLGILNSILD